MLSDNAGVMTRDLTTIYKSQPNSNTEDSGEMIHKTKRDKSRGERIVQGTASGGIIRGASRSANRKKGVFTYRVDKNVAAEQLQNYFLLYYEDQVWF